MGRRRCCCGTSTAPTRNVTFAVAAPCHLVPGTVVGFTVYQSGSPVATGTFTTASTGLTPSVVLALPNGSYTASLDSDPSRFVRGAAAAFTVNIAFSLPATAISLGVSVAPAYVCFPACRSGPTPPLARTLTLVDSVFGATTLTYGTSSGRIYYTGSKTITYGGCGCPSQGVVLSYTWPDFNGPVNNCNLSIGSRVRSDGCFSNTPLPDSILNGRGYVHPTTTVSGWPILVQSSFTAPDCTQLNNLNHMPHPEGSVAVEITE